MANSKPSNVIVCEDIRVEDNGKRMLIGVFGGIIQVSNFPHRLNLSFLLIGTSSEKEFEFELKIELKTASSNKVIGVLEGTATASSDDRMFIDKKAEFHVPITGVSLEVPEESQLKHKC